MEQFAKLAYRVVGVVVIVVVVIVVVVDVGGGTNQSGSFFCNRSFSVWPDRASEKWPKIEAKVAKMWPKLFLTR